MTAESIRKFIEETKKLKLGDPMLVLGVQLRHRLVHHLEVGVNRVQHGLGLVQGVLEHNRAGDDFSSGVEFSLLHPHLSALLADAVAQDLAVVTDSDGLEIERYLRVRHATRVPQDQLTLNDSYAAHLRAGSRERERRRGPGAFDDPVADRHEAVGAQDRAAEGAAHFESVQVERDTIGVDFDRRHGGIEVARQAIASRRPDGHRKPGRVSAEAAGLVRAYLVDLQHPVDGEGRRGG